MKTLIFRILRWLAAAGLLVLCVRMTMRALNLEGYAAAGPLIVAFGALIAGVLLISPETVGRVCEFIGETFSGLIHPNDHFTKPPLSYRLARYYAAQQRLGEAVTEYENIIRYYPNERAAYHELVGIARSAGQAGLERKYVRKFRRRFREPFPVGIPPFPEQP